MGRVAGPLFRSALVSSRALEKPWFSCWHLTDTRPDLFDLVAEQPNRFPVAVKSTDINIGVSGADAPGAPALGQVGIDQSADVLVDSAAPAPECVQPKHDGAGDLKCTPDPVRYRLACLYTNFAHTPLFIGEDGVEQFRLRN